MKYEKEISIENTPSKLQKISVHTTMTAQSAQKGVRVIPNGCFDVMK